MSEGLSNGAFSAWHLPFTVSAICEVTNAMENSNLRPQYIPVQGK